MAFLRGEIRSLQLQPPSDWRRTKSQTFNSLSGGHPFALIVGGRKDRDELVDLAQQTVVVLAACLCRNPLPHEPELFFAPPSEQQNGSSLLNSEYKELRPGRQQLVYVGSAAALRRLLAWYLETSQERHLASSTKMNTTQNRSFPLNTILFGPPGTGKTYATVDVALEILDPGYVQQWSIRPGDSHEQREHKRTKLKERFDRLQQDGLVRFVTFHQSFSYEDFVEGLRADRGEDGALHYGVADGVFKELCVRAAARVTKAQDAPDSIKLEGRKVWKMSLGSTTVEDEASVYDDCMARGIALLGWGASLDFSDCESRRDILERLRQNGKQVDNGNYEVTAVDHFVLGMKVGDIVIATDGNTQFRAIGEITGPYQYLSDQDEFAQSRPVKWLRQYSPSLPALEVMNKQFMMKAIYRLTPPSIDLAKLQRLLEEKPTGEDGGRENTPHVLVIDEINRGNVSRIFGELITLIEESKRSGAPEALEAVLPYSKTKFSVPKNVYLVGTMNTADRSLTGLDIALRRRFVFREVPPQPNLLDDVQVHGVNVGDLLRTMNQRIEVLLDGDHCLGHAYFMPLGRTGGNTLAALADIFRRQVLPLLQEYFFEDWERIGWVLNDPAKKDAKLRFLVRPESTVDHLFPAQVAASVQDRRWRLNEEALLEIGSYRQIIRIDA